MLLSELKVNLQLMLTRLKHLQAKKTELSKRSRTEIAELLRISKLNRAKIRVESILREDYLIESMEVIELYCELIVSRIGVLNESDKVPPSLEEPLATVIYSGKYLVSEVPEVPKINKILTKKYGKQFVQACSDNSLKNVNLSIVKNMTYKIPDPRVVDRYLEEIARAANVPYESGTNQDIGFENFADFVPGKVPSPPGFDHLMGDVRETKGGCGPDVRGGEDWPRPDVRGGEDWPRPDVRGGEDWSDPDVSKVVSPGVRGDASRGEGGDPNEEFDFDDLAKRLENLRKFK